MYFACFQMGWLAEFNRGGGGWRNKTVKVLSGGVLPLWKAVVAMHRRGVGDIHPIRIVRGEFHYTLTLLHLYVRYLLTITLLFVFLLTVDAFLNIVLCSLHFQSPAADISQCKNKRAAAVR